MVNSLQEISILSVRKFPLVSSVLRIGDPGWVKNQDPVPGWKNSDPGSGMEKFQIGDKHLGSATLILIVFYFHLYHTYINSSIM
jgi:hypothetical protein